MIDTRLKAYAPNGASLGLLPAPDSYDFALPLNDTPSITLNYGLAAPKASILGQPLELAVEVTADGQTWTEPDDCRFLYIRDGRDPIKTADQYQVDSPGYVWRLSKARVLSEGLADANNQRTFTTKTPGAILKTLVTEAQARGALQGMDFSTFAAATDSAGAAWPAATLTRSYDLGTDYLQILQDLADQGWLDYRMSGRSLKLYAPTTVLAVDRTVGNSQVQLNAANITEAPFRRTWEGLADFIYVAGDGKASASVVNAGAVKPWGRQEDFISQAGVTDGGTLTTIGTRYQTLTADARAEFTRTLGALTSPGTPAPLIDYRAGDYVWSRDLDGTLVKYRLRQVTLGKDDNGAIQGNVVLNDRFLESDIRTRRELDAIGGGASATGSTGGTPSGADILPPGTVVGLTATSASYLDGATRRSQVSLDWADLAVNSDGTAMTDLARYDVQAREYGSGNNWRVVAQTDGAQSVATLSPYVPGSQWDFQVRGVDTAGNRGAWSATVSPVMATDNTPPAIPSVPLLRSSLATVVATWDGKDSVGNTLPLSGDFWRVEVHMSSVSGFIPTPGSSATLVGILTAPGTVSAPGQPYQATRYVKLLARDTDGNSSAASTQASVVVVPASDGATPQPPGGWTATLQPLGVMALQASWPAVPNQDAVTYDVYLDTANPPAISPTYLVGSTAATTLAIRGLASGAVFVAGTPYYARVVARDADGANTGSPSAVGTAMVRQADSTSISAGWVYANGVEAAQVNSGNLNATLAILGSLKTSATGGRNIAISTADGFAATDQNGNLVATIPTDSALNILLNLDAILKTATALGPISMRALNNELATGATLKMKSTSSAPVTAPTPKITWPETTAVGNSLPSWRRGSSYHGGLLWTALATYGVGGVEAYNASTGAYAGGFSGLVTQDGSSTRLPIGVVRIGSFLYVLLFDTNRLKSDGINARWFVQKFNVPADLTVSAGYTFVSEWEYAAGNDVPYYPALGTDGTNLLVARSNPAQANKIVLQVFNPTSGAQVGSTLVTDVTLTSNLYGVARGNFDYGAGLDYWVVSTGDRSGGDTNYVFNTLTGTTAGRLTTAEWPVGAADNVSAAVWDSSASLFRQLSRTKGSFYTYDGTNWTTESSTWGLVNTWRDTDATGGFHESSVGPAAVLTMKKRARLTITSPDIPVDPNVANHDDADSVSFYVNRGGGAYFRQAAPAAGVTTVTVPTVVFSNSDTLHPNPPVTGNFPLGTPGAVVSDDEAYYFNGLGDANFRLIRSSYMPRAKKYLSAAQSIPNNAETALTNMTVADYDVGSMTATSNRITVTIPGRYLVEGFARFAASATGYRAAFIYRNGLVDLQAQDYAGATASIATCRPSDVVTLAAGDYLQMTVIQTSGGALNVTGGTATGTHMRVRLLDPA